MIIDSFTQEFLALKNGKYKFNFFNYQIFNTGEIWINILDYQLDLCIQVSYKK